MDPGDIPANDALAALHEQLAEARAEGERLRHEAATASARAQTAIVEAARCEATWRHRRALPRLPQRRPPS